MKAVNDLHYRPNQLAVGLVTNTTNTIGLILPDSNNPFFAALSNQLESRLRQDVYKRQPYRRARPQW